MPYLERYHKMVKLAVALRDCSLSSVHIFRNRSAKSNVFVITDGVFRLR